MFISDFAIKRPLITVVAMLALVGFGLVALLQLQTDEFPEVQPPVVLTTVIYPGASPEQVEREVLEPIEEAIQAISGVKSINGEARDGFAQIVTQFVYSKDLQEATQDIRDAISTKRQDLPQEIEEPILRKFNPTDAPIVTLGLSSNTLTPAQLTLLADPGVTREIRAIPGVADVSVTGAVKRELTVNLDPQRLIAAGVSVPQVVGALQQGNLAVPVGRVNGALDERTIRLRGRLDGPQDFMNLVVAEKGGRVVRLGDVATAEDGIEEQRTLALFNGRDAVGIEIKKTKGYSTTAVAEAVIKKVDELDKVLTPQGAKLDVVKNKGTRVTNSVNNVQSALIEGAALTVLVVFVFLNSWRSTVITGLALPVSVLASFVAVYAFGFTLNTMSLLGLSLAIGILIDDAIVVRENIVRHVEMGKDHYTAAREGTDEIGLAVAATTFSIIAVFVPIAFLQGESGQWFKPFALTIACSVLVSLFVSFSLDPMLSAYWPDPHLEEHQKGWLTKLLDRFNNWFNGLANGYRGLIGWALDHPKSMVLLAVSTFVFALAMPAMGWVGGSFFPLEDNAELMMTVETPPGANVDYLRQKVNETLAATDSLQNKEVLYTFVTAGGVSGAVDVASVYLKLKPKGDRLSAGLLGAEELAAKVREDVKRIGGATVSVFTNDFAGQEKQFSLELRGQNKAALQSVADQYLAALKSTPGAVDVGLSTKGQKPELTVQIDRGLAGSLGLSVGQVAQAIRPAFAGLDAGDWVDPSNETRKVMVRLAPEARARGDDLAQLPIAVGQGNSTTLIPLAQVATIKSELGPAVVNHLDRENVIKVQANVAGRSLSEVQADLEKKTASIQLPPGVSLSSGGQVEQQNEVFSSIFIALGVAVALMYLILVVQFGSFLDPISILISLPLSLIGVMGALAITGNTINLMSLIGVILLCGIVAKNAILLIDFAKWAREKNGMPLREALIEAGAIRLRPILMTTFALIAGMVPVALGRGEGAQFRAPLGVAVIGGVITSTVLTLLVIPTFYEIFDKMRTSLARRVGLTPPRTGEFRTFEMPVPDAGD
ncbi:efflux RND transporter permease subunit [Gemmatimonas phototrophica]|uniref:Acriflavin resistance protein n=1 Tax=Gemmatimonas phototrophica TaxID=1379270 RepID=A0A143BLD8_9BACT|nr:efflux RND transporter permease subunit [Gemmatimonas phototrophica]AMW05857.1 acriflavin resistance protein [Gemmatimonas phototrophica]